MRWMLGILGFASGWSTLASSADVQQSTYHVTVAAPSSGSSAAQGDGINPGPLASILPQMNELQQWVLCGVALLITCLVGLLIKLWWNRHQQTKEQS